MGKVTGAASRRSYVSVRTDVPGITETVEITVRASGEAIQRVFRSGPWIGSYEEYLRSPTWRLRRARFFKNHPRRCVRCGAHRNLVLHHGTYARLGAERDDDLHALCKRDHTVLHAIQARKHLSVEEATLRYLHRAKVGTNGQHHKEEAVQGQADPGLPPEEQAGTVQCVPSDDVRHLRTGARHGV